MDIEIINRVKNMANMILENKSTVREVALYVGYSKSTVHKDLTEKLRQIDYDLYTQVKDLLEHNKLVRHIRGGESTKNKYVKESLQCHEIQVQ